jgi:hypothetical protein
MPINPDFRSTLRYHARAEPATLLDDFKELHILSMTAKRWSTIWGVSTGVWIVASIILLVVVANVPDHAGGWIFLCIVGGLGGGITLGILTHRAIKSILVERRRKLAAAVVRALGCDVPPGGELEVTLDFADYHNPKYRTQSWQLTTYQTSQYRQNWLTVFGKLADGTSLQVDADLVAIRKERAKTKGRKKIKEDLCEHIKLSFRVKEFPAQSEERFSELLRKHHMPQGARLHRSAVKNGRLMVEVRTHRHVRVTNKGTVVSGGDIEKNLATHHTLLMPLLATYRALHHCRKMGS